MIVGTHPEFVAAADLPRVSFWRTFEIVSWVLVCWVVVLWRLGYPSFWDPDEAHYAQATREMLQHGTWFVPMYNGQPFFDKPILFYALQMASFLVFGATEFAARLVPALSALALFWATAWLGRWLFHREIGWLGALMLAVLPATFALTNYAILDMTFTLFLFGGSGMLVVAALRDRPALQWGGYVMLAAAVLTKGPVGLALAGLAFVLSLIAAPQARPRLLALRWGWGLILIAVIAMPWFLFMWLRFGEAFVNGYVLNENLWLFTRPLYTRQPSYLFYVRVTIMGLLPWTPLLLGRLIDVFRGSAMTTVERLLWVWVLSVVAFFSLSQFKLDHYVFPASPALCLLAAHAWIQARGSERIQYGVIGGAITTAALLIIAGIVLVPGLQLVPMDLSVWTNLIPATLIVSGIGMVVRLKLNGWRPRTMPVFPVAALVITYAVVGVSAMPAFERAKPIRALAQRVGTMARPSDHVAMYRMNRWSSSFRFYVERQTEVLQTPEDLRRFFAQAGTRYCVMRRRDYDEVVPASGVRVRILFEETGVFTTTGKALRAGRGAGRSSFVVVTNN